MANLTSKTAFDGLLPITAGSVTMSERTPEAITWISPSKGKMSAASRALERQIGASFPEPNQITGQTARALWFGPGEALVLGTPLRKISNLAMSDQSSAWAVFSLEGASATHVLARLVPIDLREDAFAVGQAARTLLGHMNCVLIRAERDSYEIMVFRSMAATAAHEVSRAMAMVAARDMAT